MLAHHVGPRGTRAPLAHQRALRLPERAPRPRAQRAAAAWPLSNHTVAAWPAPAERASRGVCAVPRSRRRVAVRRQRGRPVLATASPSQQGAPLGPSAEPKKENFATRLLKPLRDFGFGRVSFWEGGVGLFVFAGIGAPLQPLRALSAPPGWRWHRCHDAGTVAGLVALCQALFPRRGPLLASAQPLPPPPCSLLAGGAHASRRLCAGAGELGARGPAGRAGQGLPGARARAQGHAEQKGFLSA